MKKSATRRTVIQRSRDVSPAQKAAFHNVTGAGKRHVLRKFFGLSEADAEAIRDRVERYIDDVITRGTS